MLECKVFYLILRELSKAVGAGGDVMDDHSYGIITVVNL